MRRHLCCLAVLGGLLVGCEEESPESTCSLAVALTGDVSATLTSGASVGCVIQHSLDAGIDVAYVPIDEGELKSVDLVIDEITKGQTGAGFPASVRVRREDGSVYATAACTVDVEEHESRGPVELGEAFRVAGKGSCAAPAMAEDSGTVSVAPFEFVVQVTWRD